jgi:hypothetical protein
LRPTRILRLLFSDKCLKKWYLLPATRFDTAAQRPSSATPGCPFERRPANNGLSNGAACAASGRARVRAAQNHVLFVKHFRDAWEMHNECANFRVAARNFVNDEKGYRMVKQRHPAADVRFEMPTRRGRGACIRLTLNRARSRRTPPGADRMIAARRFFGKPARRIKQLR